MALPEWADKSLSDQLPILRDKGEGQHVEFMEQYPTQAHELGKEIAAFATSNAGLILIGVSDSGIPIGLEAGRTAEGRDALSQRLEGICTSHVKPSITPVIKFAVEDEKIILAIEVPKGRQPIYYSAHRPYIRHLSQSRPAEPHEVIELIEDWLQLNPQPDAKSEEATEFLSNLAAVLGDVLIVGSELDDRNVNPWFDSIRSQMKVSASVLRELASSDQATVEGLTNELRNLADELDEAANLRMFIGRESWNAFETTVEKAVQRAIEIKAKFIDTVGISKDSEKEIARLLKKSARDLADLDRRANDMVEQGRIEEVQTEASAIGLILLKIASYKLDFIASGFATELAAIGRALHLLETRRLYLDGGRSVNELLQALHVVSEQLQKLLMLFPEQLT